MSIKPECFDQFRQMAATLTRTTHTRDSGCLAYAFYQRADQPNEAVLFEQWSDQEALNNHVARLVRELGPPDRDEALPPTHHRRRLPSTFINLFDRTDAVRYESLL
jgi:hypothetical protein